MIVVSNNLLQYDVFKSYNLTIRVNIAWLKSLDELKELLLHLDGYDVFLDYPKGRTKPPKPKLKLNLVMNILKDYSNIRYLAISNVNDAKDIEKIRKKVPANIKLVPKIEDSVGIANIREIINSAKTDLIMFDKEDLYSDVVHNSKKFNMLSAILRKTCNNHNIRILELQGVIFKDINIKEEKTDEDDDESIYNFDYD